MKFFDKPCGKILILSLFSLVFTCFADVCIDGGMCGSSSRCSFFGDARVSDGMFVAPVGGGIVLSDTGDYVFADKGFTMSTTVRIRRPESRAANEGVMLFSKGDEWLFGRSALGELVFLFRDENRQFQRLSGGKTPPDGQWAHYAVRVARVSRPEKGEIGWALNIFVNGELMLGREFLHKKALNTHDDVRFGLGPDHAKWYFCGDMSAVRMWRRELTDDEIEKDALSSGKVKIAGGAKCELTSEFKASIEKLSGEDAGWLRRSLSRAAEGGADQKILSAAAVSGGAGVWEVVEFPRSKALLLLKGFGRSFPLAGFLDRRTGREVFGRRTLGWQLETGTHTDAENHFSSDEGWERRVKRTANGFNAGWRRDGLTVKLNVVLSDGRIESRIRVDNSDDALVLRNVRWPMASFARLPGDDRLILPFMNGVEQPNPVETTSEIAKHDGVYPSSSMGLQMGAYYNGVSGVYYAHEDPTASAKRICAQGRRGGIDVFFSQNVAIDHGASGGNSYSQPGAGVIEIFAGDWFDAGQIYKRFLAAKAPWWVAELPRKETPQWFRENCVCTELVIYNRTGRTEKHRRREILRMRETFELPVLAHTRYYVNHDKTGFWPHFTPDPDRMRYLNELRSHGVRVVGYTDDRLWCTKDGPGRKSDWMYSTHGKKLRIVREDGSVPREVYGSCGTVSDDSRFVCEVMCPSAQGWRQWLTKECEKIARDAGLDGIYHDQIMACAPVMCCDPAHGHVKNDPQAWVNGGYVPYLKEMRSRVAAINPETVHLSEDGVEVYCKGQLDACLNWRWCYEMVPLFTSLYAGRYQFYGRTMGDGVRKPSQRGGFFAKMAEELVWGEQLGTFLKLGQEDKVDDMETMIFVKKMAHLRKALLPYFNESEFLRPPRFRKRVPRVEYVWNRAYGTGKVATDHVRASAWKRQRDGALMAVFVNSENNPIEVEPVLPGFDNAVVMVAGAFPVSVRNGDFRLKLPERGFAVVISGGDDLIKAEKARLVPELGRIMSFKP